MPDTADWHDQQPWYHGSQQRLTMLRAGSSITQQIDLARAFSHRPSLVSQSGHGRIKHDGATPGSLYVVATVVQPEDVYPHPHPVNVSRWEWLTRWDFPVRLVDWAEVRREDRLTAEEIAELRRRQQLAGVASFAE